MSTISYPSDDFPAPVGVSINYPEGWHPFPEAAQDLAVVKDVPEGQFRPNVIVSVRRMRRGTAMPAAVNELHQRASVLPEYTAVGEEERLIDGWPGFRTEASFIDATAGTLVQAIRLAVVDRGVVEDLIQITGTCHAMQVPDTWEAIREIQESLTIMAPGRAAGDTTPAAGE